MITFINSQEMNHHQEGLLGNVLGTFETKKRMSQGVGRYNL